MILDISDERAVLLAKQLADRRGVTITQAIVEALENALSHELRPLRERLAEVVRDARRLSVSAKQRTVAKDDIDELWGND